MTRINDSPNQSVEQLKATTQQLALRVNQLERLLDGKDIDEVNFLDGMAHQRKTKFSLSNGMMKTDWKETDVSATTPTTGFTGTETVMTDLQYDTATYQFQKKTRINTYENGLLTDNGTETEWILITGGQAVDCD